ncbi:hypothetical protein [Bradyrhizobium erythrophlei]|uniref:Uncharacterized protein n=1 Tax=Bradyrhizobium erythrophlei TaxID=1437360 RepID=A0A1M5TB68_9BRAD|nr:hypothetical protein [Bradyrhizobium erythrophlei]SHH47938.1 hypothetical protein SAMN05444169_7656 [Bradyrhizobium erythrophlei]
MKVVTLPPETVIAALQQYLQSLSIINDDETIMKIYTRGKYDFDIELKKE